MTFGRYRILAGDTHCHVMPPDADYHVSRSLSDTIRLAVAEHLDFVILTPHVPGRFFMSLEKRAWVEATQQVLRAEIESHAEVSEHFLEDAGPKLLVIPGMEYTDHQYGHVGLAFADVSQVLDALPVDAAIEHPARFFELWAKRGGVTIINHPVLRPIPSAPLEDLRADLSWRGFRHADELDKAGPALPPEISWLTNHAPAVETENLSISHSRDHLFLDDTDHTFREGTHLVDREARWQRRRISPVGGSDSHGQWLRPTVWILATEASARGVREAIVAGRTCLRGPAACRLEVRGRDAAFHAVGASVESLAPGGGVDVRIATDSEERRSTVRYYVNGAVRAMGFAGELVHVRTIPGHCSVVRAEVDDGSMSAPTYVDCPWASLPSSGDTTTF